MEEARGAWQLLTQWLKGAKRELSSKTICLPRQQRNTINWNCRRGQKLGLSLQRKSQWKSLTVAQKTLCTIQQRTIFIIFLWDCLPLIQKPTDSIETQITIKYLLKETSLEYVQTKGCRCGICRLKFQAIRAVLREEQNFLMASEQAVKEPFIAPHNFICTQKGMVAR